MSKTYKVAIVGCGGMGRSHARAWNSNERTELVAAEDIKKETAEKLADQYSIAAYTDYNEMFEKEEIDIVSICTWQGVRSEITVAAAERGVKGIIGEKPMSASLGEADDMIEACEKNDVKLAIGHHRRFSATNTEIRRLVADGAIGQPIILHHRAKPNAGLLNTGTHAIDGMRYYLSDPETLWVIGQTSRKTDRWERRTRCEDLCMGLICFEGGTRGIYEGDLPGPGVSLPTITGTEGKIKIGEDGIILLHDDKKSGWQEITPPPEKTNQYQELIDWMEGEISEHRGSGRQARYTMEIMIAIYESLRIKDVVKMPLETKKNPLDLMVEGGVLPVFEPGRYDIRTPFPEQEK